MPYFVFIIQSLMDDSYYKGYSENPLSRLGQHNAGESKYTSSKTPWQLVFIQSYHAKREALMREKVLKKYSHTQIAQLLTSSLNEIGKWLVD